MDMKTNFNIGERIHELRVDSGLSQEKLALRANITTTYLGLLERSLVIVPPVATMSHPSSLSDLANSTMPLLSLTLINALIYKF